MAMLDRLISGLMLLALVLLCVAPWGVPESYRFVMPVLPFIAIFHGASPDRGRMPSWLAFLAGLTVDVLSFGPLGYWSLVYLAGLAIVATLERVLPPREFLTRWLAFTLVVSVVAGCAWLLASAYFVELGDAWPMAIAALVAACSYPFVTGLLRLADGLGVPPRDLKLERQR